VAEERVIAFAATGKDASHWKRVVDATAVIKVAVTEKEKR
jgi:hypothetical protein